MDQSKEEAKPLGGAGEPTFSSGICGARWTVYQCWWSKQLMTHRGCGITGSRMHLLFLTVSKGLPEASKGKPCILILQFSKVRNSELLLEKVILLIYYHDSKDIRLVLRILHQQANSMGVGGYNTVAATQLYDLDRIQNTPPSGIIPN